MSISKKKFFEYFNVLELNKYYEIDTIVNDLLDNEGFGDIKKLELFDTEKKKIIGYFEKFISETKDLDIIPRFEIKSDKYFIGILSSKSNILNNDQKSRYIMRDVLINKINYDITPLIFEEFCSFILKDIYDFDISSTTRLTKDGGIDFFGKYKIKNEPVNIFKEHSIYLYGQAKKYTIPVSESDIKEFSATRKNIIEGWDLRVKDKIPEDFTNNPFLNLLFFVTTSNFTSGAKYVAKIHNIVLKNIESIVDDLIVKGNDKVFKKLYSGYEINFDFLKNK